MADASHERSTIPPSSKTNQRAVSAYASLRHSLFRWLSIASLVSHVPTWMQNVRASWLMTELAPSPLLVALVQAEFPAPTSSFGGSDRTQFRPSPLLPRP